MSNPGPRPPDEEVTGREPDSLGPRASANLSRPNAESILRGLIGDLPPARVEQASALPPAINKVRDSTTEEKLRKAEIRYRLLVERIPAITFLASMDDSVQEFYVSPQIEAILGFSQKEWLENPTLWYTQLHPDDQKRWQTEFAKTVVSGAPFRSEYRFLARDGRVVWVRGEAQMVRDDAGNPQFLQGIAFDITDQKEAESSLRRGSEDLEVEVRRRTAEIAETNRALQAEILERRRVEVAVSDREARLRSIVDGAVDGIVLIDDRGVVEAFNPAAERIFGYAGDEVLGRNVSMLMPTPYNHEHDGYLANYRDTGIAKVIGIGRDVTGLRRDGSTFPMELAVSVTPTGNGRKFTGIVRDVTERKRAEMALLDAKLAAETANRLKSEFLANMSHEIRTPMNGIVGMTELALNTQLSADQREYLETVKTSADALLTVINDILDFSKIEAGKLELEPIEFHLRDTISEALKAMALRARAKGLELACDVADDVHDLMIGDPGRLRQVLINLVGNAVKFTNAGEVVVEVRLEPPPADVQQARPADERSTGCPRFVRFSVRDTGIGIAAEKQHVIFDSFTQADGSTTRKFGGTGLGLSISRRLVELMGGHIWVESAPGRGTTFHFTLQLTPSPTTISPVTQLEFGELGDIPAPVVDDNVTNRSEAPLPFPDRDPFLTERLRVLLVEDNPTNQKLAVHVLEKKGHLVVVAGDGMQALRAMELREFDLVLMDVQMPVMDGFQATAAIRLREKQSGGHMPIIALTANAMKGDRERCLQNGFDEYVSKPIKWRDLEAVIERLKRNSSLSKADPAD